MGIFSVDTEGSSAGLVVGDVLRPQLSFADSEGQGLHLCILKNIVHVRVIGVGDNSAVPGHDRQVFPEGVEDVGKIPVVIQMVRFDIENERHFSRKPEEGCFVLACFSDEEIAVSDPVVSSDERKISAYKNCGIGVGCHGHCRKHGGG